MWTTEVLLEAALVVALAVLFYMELYVMKLKLEKYVDNKIENMIYVFNLKMQSDRLMMNDLAKFSKESVPDEIKEKSKKKVK